MYLCIYTFLFGLFWLKAMRLGKPLFYPIANKSPPYLKAKHGSGALNPFPRIRTVAASLVSKPGILEEQ